MNLKQKLYDVKHAKQEAIEKAKNIAMNGDITGEEYQSLKGQIDQYSCQISEIEKLMEEDQTAKAQAPVLAPMKKAEVTGYEKAVKALGEAARAGFPKTKALDSTLQAGDLNNESVAADGGYTVPQDIVANIFKLRETKESLLDEVTVTTVTTLSGRRTYQKRAQHTGFATIAEGGQVTQVNPPQFDVMSYSVTKKGGFMPVTNELLDDSDANITAVVEEWLADEARATANAAVATAIGTASATDLTDLDGIIKAWIGLGSAFRPTAKLITNDDGLAYLATLKDDNGRYLLSPNPADPKVLQIAAGPHVLPIKVYDNATLPTKTSHIPMILGDLKEGITYFQRKAFSLSVSNTAVVGGFNAFEQDLTLWRALMRDDCKVKDAAAFVNGYITKT